MIIRLSLVVVFLALSAGCGSSASKSDSSSSECAGSVVVGSWKGDLGGAGADTLTFGADCKGTSSYCASSFTYPNVTATSGDVIIKNSATNGAAGCLPAGEFTCQYMIEGNGLAFRCGGGIVTYTKG